ncbi:MAG: hypothetical protein D6732_08000 [Methanobacteriota archaeon]|nr:MAG: hypothetical protein D6732_08000 [Euryarchaeota archaeon]
MAYQRYISHKTITVPDNIKDEYVEIYRNFKLNEFLDGNTGPHHAGMVLGVRNITLVNDRKLVVEYEHGNRATLPIVGEALLKEETKPIETSPRPEHTVPGVSITKGTKSTKSTK